MSTLLEPDEPPTYEVPEVATGGQVAYRVPCPVCGEWAQLKVMTNARHERRVVGFSCREQTEVDHPVPTSIELDLLIPH